MANPNELIQRFETLNKQVAQLHAERQKQLGMLESTKMQFESYVANYEKAYGVKLTAENLEAEYKQLMTTCQAAADELEKQINYITSGAYKQAAPAPVSVVENVVKTAPIPTGAGFGGFETQSTEQHNVVSAQPNVVPVAQPIAQPNVVPVAQSNVVPVAQSNVAPVAQPNVAPTIMQGFGTNSQVSFGAQGMPITKNVVPVVTEEEANAAKPISPVGWNVQPNAGSVDVNNLLSGQFGSKFGG